MNKDFFLNIIFPRRCPVCGEITEPPGSLICRDCFQKLSFTSPPVCRSCGKEIPLSSDEYCRDCGKRKHSFESGMALLNYDETARRSMAGIKYGNRREYLDFYGAAMAARFRKRAEGMGAEALVPVPVHPSRKKSRGFNQAEVLADRIGEQLGIPVWPDLLVRRRKTRPQKDLTPGEHLENLRGAFEMNLPEGRRVPETVILVDDIYTTGSTMEACAGILKQGGVKKVYFMAACITGGR